MNNPNMTGSAVVRKIQAGTHALFFRLETNENDHRDRRGPYRGASYLAETALAEYAAALRQSADTASERHPTPWNDSKMYIPWDRVFKVGEEQDYLFGFDKLSQYMNWFCSRKGLEDIEHAACIGVYLVPTDRNFIPGQFQAAAHRQYMQHIFDLPTTYDHPDMGRAIIEYRVDRHASSTSRA